ncbi:MAG: nucleotide disphospho-sugar-binding domain-containing protein, partial [Knoellia sp.]
GMDVRVALASGSTSRDALGPIPSSWLVRAELPQPTLLERAVLAVSHGGNNSVTEALTAGVPLLLLPMSTDQFAGAATLETAGLGEALDPNSATPEDLRAAAERLLSPDSDTSACLARLSGELTRTSGAQRARAALLAESDDREPVIHSRG